MLAGANIVAISRNASKDGDGGAVKEGNTIIYIDEIHNMIGAGRGSDGLTDTSKMLKQYLGG